MKTPQLLIIGIGSSKYEAKRFIAKHLAFLRNVAPEAPFWPPPGVLGTPPQDGGGRGCWEQTQGCRDFLSDSGAG